jgi:hypothetical protein
LAREELDRILTADVAVPWPDGTEKLVAELTWKEVFSIEPSIMFLDTVKWISRYAAAKRGEVDLGFGRGMKHVDELTLEDAPRLEKAIETNYERFEAVIEVGGLKLGTIYEMEELGIEADGDQRVIDWLWQPRSIEESRRSSEDEGGLR